MSTILAQKMHSNGLHPTTTACKSATVKTKREGGARDGVKVGDLCDLPQRGKAVKPNHGV